MMISVSAGEPLADAEPPRRALNRRRAIEIPPIGPPDWRRAPISITRQQGGLSPPRPKRLEVFVWNGGIPPFHRNQAAIKRRWQAPGRRRAARPSAPAPGDPT